MRAFQAAAVARARDFSGAVLVYDLGAVSKKPATPYLEVGVSSGSGQNTLLHGVHGGNEYRVTVRAVGDSYNEAAFAVEKAEAAFKSQRLVVGGFDTTPCQGQVASPVIRDPDGGVLFSCLLTYVFNAYPLEW